MSKVFEWSTAAGSNNDAPPDGWPENMLPGKVNDCAREMMAALACWYADQTAALTTAGTTTAYTLATNSGYDALSDIPLLAFKLHAANTGACTLNVDGLGAKPLRKNNNLGDYGSGELVSGQTVVVAYNSGTDDFETVGPGAASDGFAAGTKMIFEQTAAPTGWTKNVTHNDKALRLVSGTASSGGTTAFTSVFASRTILQANLPNINIDFSALEGDLSSTSINNGTNVVRTLGNDDFGTFNCGTGGHACFDDVASPDHATLSVSDGGVEFDGLLPLGGSGTAMDFAVQYVDVISATKA